MSFSNFIAECNTNESTKVTHVLCASKDATLAKYVKHPYKMGLLKLFFSMTKTFSSLAIGIASDLGLLDIDDLIFDFFKDDLPQTPDRNLHKITIRHLLTMSSGIHDNTYAELFVEKNWIKAFLKQRFPHEPGTFYRYSTHGSHMLSAIITKVSFLSLEAFLDKYLFNPMDIYEAQWEQSPENLTAGGMGLSLYPESLVKISQLLLNQGVYNGRQLISKNYLAMATKQQIIKQNDINDSDNLFCGTGYGFQFHIGNDNYYRLDGAFGQLCLICPRKNLAVIVFSQYSNMETLLSLVYKHLLEPPFIWDDFAVTHESSKLLINSAELIPCKKYKLSQNDLGMESVEIVQDKEDYNLIICYREYTNIIKFSYSQDKKGHINFIKDLQVHPQEYVCRTELCQALKLNVFLIETPYVATYTFIFGEKEIQLDFSINVNFTLKNHSIKGLLYTS